ncbi:MAG: heavy-metal-associated domain-containing protein [Flavobacteriales bacterium]|nr:heavy-metal-associated domain-containing protein [Flavobacteriales bacterium]
MSLLSENVIPGNHGTTFETDAKEDVQMAKIKSAIEKMNGVRDVIIENSGYPRTFTVHTNTLVEINEIEKEVKACGFHAIPKSIFAL